MTYEEAKRLLHPDTTRDAIWEISDRDEAIRKIEEACLTACNLIDELQEYKKLGTLEEIINALEKQKPKKLINFSWVTDLDGRKMYKKGNCPNCGCKNLLSTETDYCRACGQNLYWDEEE